MERKKLFSSKSLLRFGSLMNKWKKSYKMKLKMI